MTSTPDLSAARWFTSKASSATGGCLEVAFLDDGRVAIRDNEDLSSPPFVVTRHVWACFIDGARNGEFTPPPAT
ncbi:protein of unknown function [Streptomyces harbinensis]|uniref:DUF397 domain-containing protein n=1 Tax=Streptomyces harbinensis TaxID=1176198 RepID=A0A1I6WC47_9ACTN|nr:DUF397 domain-containing protein [Streptomyces harbinensis]SFT23557.1 protein of unknown function [Streptomyces harbinensis]